MEMTGKLSVVNQSSRKGVRAFRGYFGPPMRSKDKSYTSFVSSYLFIRTMAKV